MYKRQGPGILSNIFDGIERPLKEIAKTSGAFIPEGSDMPALDVEKKWPVTLKVKEGDRLKGGDVFAACPETSIIEHRSMVPPGLDGTVVSVRPDGDYTVLEPLVVLRDARGTDHELALAHKWPCLLYTSRCV